jgi:hypothetical protein
MRSLAKVGVEGSNPFARSNQKPEKPRQIANCRKVRGASRCPNKPRTLPKSREVLGNPRAIGSPDVPVREFAVYDGRDQLGAVVERNGGVDVFDPVGVHLGTFPNVKAAAAALSLPRSSSCVPHQRERGGGGGK